MRWMVMAAALAFAGAAGAQNGIMTVAGHSVEVNDGTQGDKVLLVDGQLMHLNGVIYLDDAVKLVGGISVVTGSAGPAGNACNAAPFVLALPEGAAPEFYGPINSCAYLPVVDVQSQAIVFASEPTPSQPGEVWVWNRLTGMTEALPEAFVPVESAGWDTLGDLAGAHPAEALTLAPVFEALVAGLGPDCDAFAARISGLGSGDLTEAGYLGEACEKFTCEADFAVLYLHAPTERVFAIWHVAGEIENRIWPQDTTLWPTEAMAVLRAKGEGG